LVWVRVLALRDVRNLREQRVELSPGLNVFLGQNAQGKTSLLEAVGLLARGRSFRTDDLGEVVGRGAEGFFVKGTAAADEGEAHLAFRWTPGQRTFSLDDHKVTPRDYSGRLEASVYSTDRLRVVHGPMRERRQYVDRAGAALSATYRQNLREYERIVHQRNAALQGRHRALEAWDERLAEVGGALRVRRLSYVERLNDALATAFRPEAEAYAIQAEPTGDKTIGEAEHQDRLAKEIRECAERERHAGRSLVGPHRDAIHLLVDGQDAASSASSGQVRSLLLALTLATLRVYREQTGRTAIALLDDLDSELDAERALAVCRTVADQGQALVTSAHPEWASRLGDVARQFRVSAGRVSVS
jgi:DNA replication and repair protein RecF